MTEYLKVKEYAKERQLSPWTVYRLIDNGEIDFVRLGRSIRVVVRNSYIQTKTPKWKGIQNGE